MRSAGAKAAAGAAVGTGATFEALKIIGPKAGGALMVALKGVGTILWNGTTWTASTGAKMVKSAVAGIQSGHEAYKKRRAAERQFMSQREL